MLLSADGRWINVSIIDVNRGSLIRGRKTGCRIGLQGLLLLIEEEAFFNAMLAGNKAGTMNII
ncbi:hypothetical protein K663_17001 [Sphingobium sp. MI1205]|nr:hypothetical protein K663_17001 [Sphingobium sp. MI1205]